MRTCHILTIFGLILGAATTTPAMASDRPDRNASVEVYTETLNQLRDYSRSWIAPETTPAKKAQDVVIPLKKPSSPAIKQATSALRDLPLPDRKPVYRGPPLKQSVVTAAANPYKPLYSQAKSVPVDGVRAESLTPPPYTPPQFEISSILTDWFYSIPEVAAQTASAMAKEALSDPAAIEPASGVATYSMSLRFEPEQLTLNEPQSEALSRKNFSWISRNPHQRIQIYSYASSKTGNESEARRISLARALEVRALLVQHDIDARRIDIIAKGKQNQDLADLPSHLTAPDRIEIVSTAPGESL